MALHIGAAGLLGVVALTGCATGIQRGFAPSDDHNMGEDAAIHDGAVPVPVPDAQVPDAHVDGKVADAALDSGALPDASVTPDAGPDAATLPDGGTGCAPTAGALVITEVMIASAAGGNDRGEWFEITNTGACTVSLAGVELVSPTSAGNEKKHAVSGGLVAPGAYFVFALSGEVTENHNLPYDYVYGDVPADDVILNNSADWLELRFGGNALDRVTWPGSGFVAGKSRAFPVGTTATTNDTWSNSCNATATYATVGGTFYGTPRAANAASCP